MYPLVTVATFALLLSCATPSRHLDGQGGSLSEFLAVDSSERLAVALGRGDARYLVVAGYVTSAPCSPDDTPNDGFFPERNFLWIPLTPTADAEEDYEALYGEAFRYACRYNRSLTEELLVRSR